VSPEEAVDLALGVGLRATRPAGGMGYTGARRWLVELDDGSRAFVKAGDDPMLRMEVGVYRAVSGPFMPEVFGTYLDDGAAVLVLEDLSGAIWPPPYPEDVAPLLDAVAQVAEAPPPDGLPALRRRERPLWETVAEDPRPFLGLGACSRAWLDDALPALVEAERRAVKVGDELVHYDIWGANLCFDGPRALLVDWGAAVRGDPRVDLAFTLFALRFEAGRRLDVDFPEEGAYAAELAVSQALEATRPLPDWAPPDSTLRADQAAAVRPALLWAAEELGLAPP
jgi:hypothetical protein